MTVTANKINVKKVFPCDEHKYIVRKQNIILYLLTFDIIMGLIQNGYPELLILGLIKLF